MASKPDTIPTLRAEHKAEEAALVRSKLESCGWSLTETRLALGLLSVGSLQAIIKRHGLQDEYQRHAQRPGRRPRGKT